MRSIEEPQTMEKTQVGIVVAKSQVWLMKTCVFREHEKLNLEEKILYNSIYFSLRDRRCYLCPILMQTWNECAINF